MGFPSKGTSADKRLAANQPTAKRTSSSSSTPMTKQAGMKSKMSPAQHEANIKQMADPASPVGMKQPMTPQEMKNMQCQ